ncbi:hypothetical protein EMIT0P258_110077 [Pseudomonas sp. IT-P258]
MIISLMTLLASRLLEDGGIVLVRQ